MRTGASAVMAEKQEIVELGNSNRNPDSTAARTDSTAGATSSESRSNPDEFPIFAPPSLLVARAGVPSSSTYSSARIERMLHSRSAFASDVEFEIEASRVHWSELQSSSSAVHGTSAAGQASADGETHLANEEILQRLRNQWPTAHPGFFRELGDLWEVGAKIAEGAQAEIFEARFGDDPDGDFDCVLKVFKEGASVQELQRQWPPGMMKQLHKELFKGQVSYLSGVWEGLLLSNGRFAFQMVRHWGDLRKLIDLRMQCNGNQSSPFSARELERNMHQIALGMETLSKCNIVHGDLKASNVLIRTMGLRFDPTLIHYAWNNFYWCVVAAYECSVGVVGTGFWRAPEILQGMKDRNITLDLFTEASNVYSFAMTCYEMITGQLPFEDMLLNYYDVVLEGGRPILPHAVKPWIKELLNRCWDPNPLERPSFKKIVKFLKLQKGGWKRPSRQDVLCNWLGCFRL